MKNNNPSRSVSSQIVLGLLVILMGLLFLLDNLDILDMHRAVSFWPMVFIIAGIVKLWDTQTRGGQLMGAGLVGLGVLIILDRMDVIDFSVRTMWPLFLIGAGGYLLYKAVVQRGQVPAYLARDGKDGKDGSFGGSDTVDVVAILGGFERRVTTPAFRGGEVTAVMGGCALDLRNASIEGEAVINVFAFWGGVTLKVPPDWTIVLQGTPIMGGFEEKTITPPDTSKRLVIQGYAIMGGVEVRN